MHFTIVQNTNNGSTWITDTATYTPLPSVPGTSRFWTTVQVINDAVFTTLTEPNAENSPGATSVKAGTLLTGNFTAIKLASGAVKAYYGAH